MRTLPTRPTLLASLLLAAVHAAPAAALAAQEATDSTRPLIIGRVLDADTGEPVRGAMVSPAIGAYAVLTDSAGVFRLPMELAPQYVLTVEQLGYSTFRAVLGADAPKHVTVIRLPANPVELEGLSVLVDRFERRRRRYFGPVDVLDGDELARSAYPSAYDAIRARVPMARPCAREPGAFCVLRRGQIRQMRVCLDEMPLWSDLEFLTAFAPQELYMIEVYDRGQQVRVYTRQFVERKVRGGQRLMPLAWSC